MKQAEFDQNRDELLHPGEWTEVYLDDANMFMKRRWYCGDCGEWNTYGETPFCPYCGEEKKVIE